MLSERGCVYECSSATEKLYIDENNKCVRVPERQEKAVLPGAEFRILVDSNYTLVGELEYNQEVAYNTTELSNIISVSIIESYEYGAEP